MTSSRPAVRSTLESIFRDELNITVSKITAESRLVDDLGLDSVAFAIGMAAIEDKFEIRLSDAELLGCNTFGDLEAAITAKIPK